MKAPQTLNLFVNESAVDHRLLRGASHKHCSDLVMPSGLRKWFKM